MEINLLESCEGDCIHLRFGNNEKTNIIIDSGPECFGDEFYEVVKSIVDNGEKVNALFLTHIDDDHIGGFLSTLRNFDLDNDIEMIYVNDDEVDYADDNLYSVKAASQMLDIIKTKNIKYENNISTKKEILIGDSKITILTPKFEDMMVVSKNLKEYKDSLYGGVDYTNNIDECTFSYRGDGSPSNRASISFIISYDNKNYMFLGDAHINKVIWGLDQIGFNDEVEYIKLSHHGKPYNINKKFLDRVKCNKFLLTTDEPIKKNVLNLILSTKITCEIYCNYNWWQAINYFTSKDIEVFLDSGKLKIEKKNYIKI